MNDFMRAVIFCGYLFVVYNLGTLNCHMKELNQTMHEIATAKCEYEKRNP